MGHLCFEWLSSVVGSRMDEATHAKKYKQKIVSKNNVYKHSIESQNDVFLCNYQIRTYIRVFKR